MPEKKDTVPSYSQTKLSSFPIDTTSALWTSGAWNNSQATKLVPEIKDNISNLSQNKANSTSGTTSSFAASWSSGVLNKSQPTMGLFNPEKKALPENNSSEAKSSSEKPVFPTFGIATNTSSSSPWGSVFSGSQTPVFPGRLFL